MTHTAEIPSAAEAWDIATRNFREFLNDRSGDDLCGMLQYLDGMCQDVATPERWEGFGAEDLRMASMVIRECRRQVLNAVVGAEDAWVFRLAFLRTACESGEARTIRERARLSRLEVATHCGVTYKTIRRWETGELRPRGEGAKRYFEMLIALEEALDSPAAGAEAIPRSAEGPPAGSPA